VSSRGGEPCHVALDPRGRFVYVANYGTGSVAAFPLGENGAIIDEPTMVQHQGRGPNPRQDGPRMHAVLPDEAGDHVVVCDLGTDTVAAYRVTDGGIDASRPVSSFASAPGAGPRQLAFSPGGKHLFVVNEFAATVDSFRYEAGVLDPVDHMALLPDDWLGENLSAAVIVHPGGRFGYASNRGHDSITVFSIDSSGGIKRLGWQRDGVAFPRDIAVDPDGRILLVANQNQQTIAAHDIDRDTGMLAMTGAAARFASPSCLVFHR
jgi:6-phosphogluconolactonase